MGSLIKVFLLCCATLEIYGAGQKNVKPLVTTKYGQLLGKTVDVKGTDRSVHAFMGVPFAKPPTGPLRYAEPQPPEPWSSVKEATAPPPMCLQNPIIMEHSVTIFKANAVLPPILEDCLYLNIFTPADREKNSKLPVMVFIHGGGLAIGYASLYDGSALSAYENIVMVSIQYRLGPLGFFSTGDKEVQANLGLLDQVAAFQWVQENIKEFGGDPQSVTIFGESAGGLSVSAHILSPLSKGLFHRAIAESGVAIFPNLMVHQTEDVLYGRDLIANISECDLPLILNCLKNKTEDEMLEITVAMGFTILPVCVDGIFLPKPAEEILAAKESNPVPYMEVQGAHVDTISQYQWNDGWNGEDRRSVSTKFFSIDSGLPVYFYEFQHRPSLYDDSKADFVKADHGDELYFVLGGPFLNGDVTFQGDGTDEEKVLSKKIMKYWANFARYGDPNGPGLTEWLKYDEDEHYMELNLKQKMSQRLKEERFKFWTNTLPETTKEMREKRDDHTEL
ncbi:pyrethroid hydrolase Ces2e [Xenopus laevis]|uniref:Carboxylic ester hydrolase n=1 Tax=Xenopus laevis TaxID=8355 RepID=A0A8J1MXW9_XENLA|nr:pyrethroid hydrolase Ces2e [Xenopus laevis]